MAIDEIMNFVRIDERLATAGQPTEAQIEEVAAAGYEIVVNLGLHDPNYCLPDEAGLVARLGMAYHHIPVPFAAPAISDFHRFVDVMDGCAARRTFVHCVKNMRASAFVALYGQLRLGWRAKKADARAARFRPLDETWRKFMDDCRRSVRMAG